MADLHSFQPPSADPPDEWYTYVPLCNERHGSSGLGYSGVDPTIRLMTLLPETEGDPIQCSLAVVKPISGIRLFDEQLKPPDTIYYEALSYVWGDVSKTEQIICDGKLLKITESLAVALRALRQPETSRVLWADGICINQQDMEERAGQVLLMSSIFSLAAQVICWLDHDDNGHAESVFRLAEMAATEFDLDSIPTNGMATIDTETVFEKQTNYLNHIASTGSEGEAIFLHIICMALHILIAPFLHRLWFSRMWIRQEVGYASKAVVLSGKSQVDAKILHWLIAWAVMVDEVSGSCVLPIGSIYAFTSYGHSLLVSLLDLLVRCRPWRCTDPRDKIFALLSHPTAWVEEPLAGEKDYCARVMATMRAGRAQEVLPELAKARQELHQDFQNWLTFDPRHQYSLAQEILKTSSSSTAESSNSTDDERDSMASRSSTAYSIDHLDLELLRRIVIIHDEHSDTHIQRRIQNAFNQARRINELGDLRLHPIYRIAKGSNFFTATSRPIIKPSYRNSLQEMNIALAIEFLRLHEGGGMHILCVVQHSISTAQTFGNGFPTWVPEWVQPDIYCHIGLHAKRLTRFRPCGEIEGNMTITLTPPTIILAGIVVDTIASITEPIPADMIAHSEACLELWQTIVRISGPSHALPDQQKLQSFCRLLTVDNFECATPSFHHQLQDNATLFNSFTTFWSDMNTHINSKSGPFPTSDTSSLPDDLQTNEQRGNSFWKLALLVSRNRRVFSTTKGYLGIGPQILQEGDMVCIFPAVPVPLILRPTGEHFLLVGESYVDGIMYGEEADRSKVRRFDIR